MAILYSTVLTRYRFCTGGNQKIVHSLHSFQNCRTNIISKLKTEKRTSTSADNDLHLDYIYIYAGLLGALFVFAILRAQNIFSALLSSSKAMHLQLLNSISHAPMRFFDKNGRGLILRLFSNDIGVADEEISYFTFHAIRVS